MSKNRVLAIVGAGEAAFPIIKKAREMGVETIAFGEADSLARNQADVFVETSIFDIDKMVRACRHYLVNGVIASSEITTESAAILSFKLGLPGNRCNPNFFARNKYLMREKIKCAKNVKQPRYCLYQGEEIKSFPIMVKAVDACGKRGISLVKNEAEFVIALNSASVMSSDGTVLIEEYITGGKEVSVECLADGNRRFVIQITDKITSGPPHFTEIAHHQPAVLDSACRKKIDLAANEILSLLGIDCGMAHLELKVVNDDIYFIEVGARAGGDHIADTLVGLSTDYDYYRGAIDCCFDGLETPNVHNIAYSGIIFHCLENIDYKDIFEKSKNADWCVVNNVKENDDFQVVNGNVEATESGYIIYRADHRIMPCATVARQFSAEVINGRQDAFELIWNHNKEIGRTLSDEELKIGINKFIDKGNVIAIIENNKIVAFLMLYCNDFESLEAYICNVYVLESYRGLGLSKRLMDKAIEICKRNDFKTIKLHVAEDNTTAINLYNKYRFYPNGKTKDDGERLIEMIKKL